MIKFEKLVYLDTLTVITLTSPVDPIQVDTAAFKTEEALKQLVKSNKYYFTFFLYTHTHELL